MYMYDIYEYWTHVTITHMHSVFMYIQKSECAYVYKLYTCIHIIY